MVDHGFLRADGPLYRPTRALERVANGAADLIVTSTANAAHRLRHEFGVPGARVRTVADGVDVARFRPAAPRTTGPGGRRYSRPYRRGGTAR